MFRSAAMTKTGEESSLRLYRVIDFTLLLLSIVPYQYIMSAIKNLEELRLHRCSDL